MAKTRNLQITYSGISGGSPIQRTIANTGQSEVGHDTICAAGTTTLNPVLILNPTTAIRCYAMLATGDCSVHCDVGGTDTTITLTANVPVIQTENADGSIFGLPSGADTLTLKVHNATGATIGFTSDFLIE